MEDKLSKEEILKKADEIADKFNLLKSVVYQGMANRLYMRAVLRDFDLDAILGIASEIERAFEVESCDYWAVDKEHVVFDFALPFRVDMLF
ncbi:MAG: hypothetical protein NC548_32395 [Lachnospiraceae bacterium]|nr:hypothetical protein [Lachnospiraceae bacterium]